MRRTVKVMTLQQIEPNSIRQVQHDLLTTDECTVIVKRTPVRVMATAEQIQEVLKPVIIAKLEAKKQQQKKKQKKATKGQSKKKATQPVTVKP